MIDRRTRQAVLDRAGRRCEYCLLPELLSPLALQVEHIVPRKHGGDDSLANLACACIACNLHKGANLSGIDPDTGHLTELFNPRQQVWSEHFRWEQFQIVGTTSIGRTSVRVLNMNSLERQRVHRGT